LHFSDVAEFVAGSCRLVRGMADAGASALDEGPFGGRGGIRTHGTVSRTPVFKTGSLNHSDTLPRERRYAQRLPILQGLLFGR
jgi:hypothetical protein